METIRMNLNSVKTNIKVYNIEKEITKNKVVESCQNVRSFVSSRRNYMKVFITELPSADSKKMEVNIFISNPSNDKELVREFLRRATNHIAHTARKGLLCSERKSATDLRATIFTKISTALQKV